MACCGIIAFQDFRERAVQWVWFPILGLVLSLIYIEHTSLEQYLVFATTNILLVSLIIGFLFLYTKYIAKARFLNVSFGLGDLLFFYAFALGFPSMTFVLLFTAALFFSFLAFLASRTLDHRETVPLAGLMGLFLLGIHAVSFIPNVPYLYVL
ncbi:MAG: hypothetical protein AAFX53_06270 [Bacteroidota bacterium]